MPNTISLGCQWGNAFTTFFKEINVILNIVHFERKIEKDRNRGRKIKREREGLVDVEKREGKWELERKSKRMKVR